MTEDQLRALVREIVEERLSSFVGRVPPEADPPKPQERGQPALSSTSAGDRPHSSHHRLRVAAGAEAGGACLIEPAVRCNLCGYCQSLGH
jgi:hypothetical protein